MKVYNKKTFAFGVFSTALGVLNAVTAALRGADAGDIVLIACLLFFGIGALLRGRANLQKREIRRKAVSGGGRMPLGRGRGASGVVKLRRMKGTLPTRRAKRKSSCLRLCAACVCFYFFAFFRPST